jgi:hypothetical protein
VFLDVATVQTEALLADLDGRVRIHGLEGALGAIRVLAQLAVEMIEDGQYQLGHDGNFVRVGTGIEASVCLIDPELGLSQHQAPITRCSAAPWRWH